MNPTDNAEYALLRSIGRLSVALLVLSVTLGFSIFLLALSGLPSSKKINLKKSEPKPAINYWIAPPLSALNANADSSTIAYGRELIANTALYLGPKGKVKQITNGMNCQNCHLDAGTKIFGNNYGAVAATYPKFRERSGSSEDVYKRVNDCIERSLNGKWLDTNSREMQAIRKYIEWLGANVEKGAKPAGAGLKDVPYLDRAADPEKGKIVYGQKCTTCHGKNGEGKYNAGNITYQYPPLWGPDSYNTGAGLFRISRFAAYAKANMPFGATFEAPQLSDEEAWDVAAFVNSQPRPTKPFKKDWPKISAKPVDHPFGPYADTFSEQQHKYGPFALMAELKKKKN